MPKRREIEVFSLSFLDVIACGPIPPNPAELFGTEFVTGK